MFTSLDSLQTVWKMYSTAFWVEARFKSFDPSDPCFIKEHILFQPFYCSFLSIIEKFSWDCGMFPLLRGFPGPFQVYSSLKVCSRTWINLKAFIANFSSRYTHLVNSTKFFKKVVSLLERAWETLGLTWVWNYSTNYLLGDWLQYLDFFSSVKWESYFIDFWESNNNACKLVQYLVASVLYKVANCFTEYLF